jgi:hypothetical protein
VQEATGNIVAGATRSRPCTRGEVGATHVHALQRVAVGRSVVAAAVDDDRHRVDAEVAVVDRRLAA